MTRPRVLVVEDNPLNRELVADVLESMECEVTLVPSAEEGLRVLATTTPDLILLDMRLPGMSGVEAVTLIRANPALLATPVVAVTAQAMRGDDGAALRAGFDGYVSKPIDTITLRNVVRAQLERRPRP